MGIVSRTKKAFLEGKDVLERRLCLLFHWQCIYWNGKEVYWVARLKPSSAIHPLSWKTQGFSRQIFINKYLGYKNIKKIYPKNDIIKKTLELCKKYNIKGQEIFDVQIIATMLSNDVTKIYTYDKNHFERFKEIEILTL